MNNADPQLEHVDPAHPVAPDAYIRVLNGFVAQRFKS